jgi:hypothetical protein
MRIVIGGLGNYLGKRLAPYNFIPIRYIFNRCWRKDMSLGFKDVWVFVFFRCAEKNIEKFNVWKEGRKKLAQFILCVHVRAPIII